MNKVQAVCLAMFILNAAVVAVIGILSVIAYKKKEIYPEQLAVIIIHNMVTLLLVGVLEYFAVIIGRG